MLLSQGFVTAQWFSPHHQHHLQHLTPLQHSRRKSMLTLLLGLSPAHFSIISLGCQKLFSDFHLSILGPLLLRSSLPAWLPWEPSDLSGLELVVPLKIQLTLSFFWPQHMRSSLPAWPSWEPYELIGLESDGPHWVAFGHYSNGPASPPNYPKNNLNRVNSIWMVPIGLQSVSPWVPPELHL